MERYDQRLLSTVYWSLGGMVTVIALVAGFGWYANFRAYDRDRAAFQQELRNIVEGNLATVHEGLTHKIQDQLAPTIGQYAALADQVKRTGDLLRSTKDSFDWFKTNELLYLKCAVASLEAFRWETKGVLSNALREHVGMLKLGMELKNDDLCARCLGSIQGDLKKGADPHVTDAAELVQVLNDLRGSFPVETGLVEDLLKAARAKSTWRV